ncbi:MAG TPA: hypothetical protein VHX38_18835 [Pseudonocardiaceae bacterium]|nr:hypothetical protein [Pseudonocardiaceae bacterium]
MSDTTFQLPGSRELAIQLGARTLLATDAAMLGTGHQLSLTPERARELAEQAVDEVAL